MAEYLTLIITVSLFCGIINIFFDEKGVGKTSRTVVNLVMLSCIVIPIMKTLVFFQYNVAVPVINENNAHINEIDESDTVAYRKWLARITADEVAKEIESSVKKYTGFEVTAECPWHMEGEDVVFDTIKIYTSSDKRYHEKIINSVKLHYYLDAECITVSK